MNAILNALPGLLIVLGVFAIAWLVIRQLALPAVVMTVLYVVAGVVAILFLLDLLRNGIHPI